MTPEICLNSHALPAGARLKRISSYAVPAGACFCYGNAHANQRLPCEPTLSVPDLPLGRWANIEALYLTDEVESLRFRFTPARFGQCTGCRTNDAQAQLSSATYAAITAAERSLPSMPYLLRTKAPPRGYLPPHAAEGQPAVAAARPTFEQLPPCGPPWKLRACSGPGRFQGRVDCE